MIINSLANAPEYFLPLHDGIRGFRLVNRETHAPPAFCSVGVSYYEPGGHAGWAAGPSAKIYIVLDGELTVRLKTGETAVLRKLDSCVLGPDESREILNESSQPATLLVITP